MEFKASVGATSTAFFCCLAFDVDGESVDDSCIVAEIRVYFRLSSIDIEVVPTNFHEFLTCEEKEAGGSWKAKPVSTASQTITQANKLLAILLSWVFQDSHHW